MKKIILLILLFGFASTHIIAQSKEEKKEKKSNKEYEVLKALIKSKVYVFDADWISTTRGARINIAGGTNSITVAQDSTKANMQFFGEVTSIRFSGGEGVDFNNKIEKYKVEFNDKKRRIIISFSVKDKSETYNIYMSVSKSGYAYVDVNSNNKRSVTYDGKISAIIIE